MRLSSANTNQPDSIAGYLADREGLKGARRAKFVTLLRDAFGFDLQRSNGRVFALGISLGAATLVGIFFEVSRGPSVTSVVSWFGIICLGASLMAALTRAQRQLPQTSRELEWRAYCLVIRPVILVERPGLLDRNLATETIGRNNVPVAAFGDMFCDVRQINLWLPAAVGWGIGVAFLVFLRFLFSTEEWLFILPLLGSILFPLGWGLFRRWTYGRLKRVIGDSF